MNRSTLFGIACLFTFATASCSSSTNQGGGSGGSTGSSSGGSSGSTGGSSGSSSGGSSGSGSGGTGSGGKVGSGGTSAASGGSNGSGSGGTGSGGKVGSGGTAPGSGGMGMTGSGGMGSPGSGGGGMAGGGGKAAPGSGGATMPGSGGSAGSMGNTSGVTVQMDQTHQMIEGFGLNTALGGGSVPWDTFFTTTGSGLGMSIVRVAMSSNGSLSGSIPPKSYNAKIIGSAWTAPANCKDNNNTQKGGHLLTSCYDSWSTTIANFAKSQGLYAMGAANEPDFGSCGSSIGPPCNGDYDSMVYTATEMVNFLKVLGPKMKSAGVKLLAPEPSEWLHLWSNTSATGSTVSNHPNSSDPLKCGCFGNDPVSTGCASNCSTGGGYDYGHFMAKDADVWGSIDILGTHEYDTQKAMPWPSDVDGGKRSKEVWETEVSGVMYWPEQGPSSDIKNGLAVAGWVHSALVVGEASAWLHWWYQASGSNDNEGLVLQGSTALTKRCYTVGNYSKFVRPGYMMVTVSGNSNTDLLISAFTGTGGAVVVVAVNKGSAAVNVPIAITGGTAPSMMTPYVTSSSDNLAAKTAVAVSGGSFMASLAAQSVTTFVSTP